MSINWQLRAGAIFGTVSGWERYRATPDDGAWLVVDRCPYSGRVTTHRHLTLLSALRSPLNPIAFTPPSGKDWALDYMHNRLLLAGAVEVQQVAERFQVVRAGVFSLAETYPTLVDALAGVQHDRV